MTETHSTAGKTREQIAAAYDSPPWWYDARGFLILTFAYNSTLGHQLRFFGPHFGPRHLEVACGSGTLLDMVLKWRKWKGLPQVHVTAIDYAEPMLAGAIRRFARRADVEVRHADASQLPYEKHSFDTATIANSLHSFPDPAAALRDVFRVLKPGGSLAANVLLHPRGIQPLRTIAERINAWGMQKGILVSPYSVEDVRRLLTEAGFRIEREQVSGNCFDVIGRRT